MVAPPASPEALTHRLVLVEGLPKSGKTTTADWLGAKLAQWAPTVWHESDPAHPIGMGWPNNAAEVIRSCVAARYPFSEWETFVADCNRFHIMEARFCQNAACFALLAGDDAATATSVSARIARLTAVLHPHIVYLRVADPEAHAAGVLRHFDAMSRAYLIAAFEQQPWLQARGLTGEAGFAAALRAWAPLADRVMAEAAEIPGVDVTIIDAPERDWSATRERILRAVVPHRTIPT